MTRAGARGRRGAPARARSQRRAARQEVRRRGSARRRGGGGRAAHQGPHARRGRAPRGGAVTAARGPTSPTQRSITAAWVHTVAFTRTLPQAELRVLRAELAYEEPAVRAACPLQPYVTEAAAQCYGGGDPTAIQRAAPCARRRASRAPCSAARWLRLSGGSPTLARRRRAARCCSASRRGTCTAASLARLCSVRPPQRTRCPRACPAACPRASAASRPQAGKSFVAPGPRTSCKPRPATRPA